MMTVKHNIRNIFLDTFINEREKIELLEESTFFISASSSESFGVSIAESLDSGTPIIVRDNTIWEEYINMGCGFSFSEDQLSEIFIELNDISLDRYNRMMSTIEEKFSPVSWDDHARIFLENLTKFGT